jgi:hypothetical protein
MLEIIMETRNKVKLLNADDFMDYSDTAKLKVLKRIVNQRSISLSGPPGAHNQQTEMSLSQPGRAGGAWNKLGLYLKGLPPRALRKAQKQTKVSEEIISSANKELYSLKMDKETIETRFAWQERQFNITLANMEEEIKTTRQGLDSLREDNCEAAKHMDEHLEVVQEKIGKLIKRSLDYGQLRYEEKVTSILDAFELYATSLHHRRESIGREINELKDNIGDEKLLDEIKRIQEDVQYDTDDKMDNYFNYSGSDWIKNKDYKNSEKELMSKGNLSVVVQELKQRKVSSNKKKDSRTKTDNMEVLPAKGSSVTTVMGRFRTRFSDLVDNTIATLDHVDGQYLFNCLRYMLAVGLIVAAVVILLWPVFK